MLEYNKDLDELMEELREDKLEANPPQSVLTPEPEAFGENIGEEHVEEVEAESEEEGFMQDLDGLPELIVGILDVLLPNIAAAWTHSAKYEYKLDEDEKRQLTNAWKIYLKNKPEVKMKPETILLITTLSIYGPKFITAVDKRKEYKRQCVIQQASAKAE